MKSFLIHLTLCFLWVLLQGNFSWAHVGVGFLLTYALLWLGHGTLISGNYLKKMPFLFKFIVLFTSEILLSALQVTLSLLTPQKRIHPQIVAYPLKVQEDHEITTLAHMISLTPGSLSLNVSPDKKTLYVHGLCVQDPEKFKKDIAKNLESLVIKLWK